MARADPQREAEGEMSRARSCTAQGQVPALIKTRIKILKNAPSCFFQQFARRRLKI